MAIKNLFGRGVGFGPIHWIVTHGYDSGTSVVSVEPPSPHRLASADVVTELAGPETRTLLLAEGTVTTLHWIADDGIEMSTPLIFTAGTTGPLVLTMTGADGSSPDLTTAQSVTLRVVAPNGTAAVNAVALTSLGSDGTGTWTRTALQTATAGDYVAQAKVTDSGGNVSYYPDGVPGAMPITMLVAI